MRRTAEKMGGTNAVRSGQSKDNSKKVEICYKGRAPMAQAVVMDGSVIPPNTGAQRLSAKIALHVAYNPLVSQP